MDALISNGGIEEFNLQTPITVNALPCTTNNHHVNVSRRKVNEERCRENGVAQPKCKGEGEQ